MSWVSVGSLSIAFVSLLFAILSYIFNRKKDTRQNEEDIRKREREFYERDLDRIRKETENTTSIKTKLEEVCSAINIVKDEIRETNKTVVQMTQTQAEHAVKINHIYIEIDDCRKRIEALEKKCKQFSEEV